MFPSNKYITQYKWPLFSNLYHFSPCNVNLSDIQEVSDPALVMAAMSQEYPMFDQWHLRLSPVIQRH